MVYNSCRCAVLPPGDRLIGGTSMNRKLRAPAFTYRSWAASKSSSITSSSSSASVSLACLSADRALQ